MNVRKLKEKMYGAGYSQRKLADAMKMSKNTINAICTGKKIPTVEEARRLCILLNIDESQDKVDIFLT